MNGGLTFKNCNQLPISDIENIVDNQRTYPIIEAK